MLIGCNSRDAALVPGNLLHSFLQALFQVSCNHVRVLLHLGRDVLQGSHDTGDALDNPGCLLDLLLPRGVLLPGGFARSGRCVALSSVLGCLSTGST